jgi:type II secretory pathway pseudopilin PulG
MRRSQKGASVFFIALILVAAMLGLFALLSLFRGSAAVSNSSEVVAQMAATQSALELFASATGRLPCPANPALSTGDADPVGTNATCNFPGGTIPWKTIGLRSEDSIDPWGWRISYRVYTGNKGSLTQDNGVSMVKCDTVEPFPAGTTPLAGNSGGLCRDTLNTTDAEFLALGKGLPVTDFGTAVNDAAYVLISHGPSGLGGYTATGVQKLPVPASADEINNMAPTGPFMARAPVTTGLAPTDANYFDDVIAYQRIADFVRRANLSARDWPEDLSSLTMNTPTLTAALGAAPAYGDLGTATITFATARVTAFDAGGDQNIAFNVNTPGGAEGIGGVNSGGDGLTNTGGEGLRIDLSVPASRFAVTLNDFGTLIGIWAERAEFRFYSGGTLIATITKNGCHADGGLASFASIDAGANFDRIEIRPLQTTSAFGFSFPSSFFLSAFATCASGVACHTSLEAPGNLCP